LRVLRRREGREAGFAHRSKKEILTKHREKVFTKGPAPNFLLT